MNETKIIARCLKKTLKAGYCKIIVYPYGNLGKRVVEIMRTKYHLEPYLILDNQLADGKNVYSVEKLKDISTFDTKLFLATNRSDLKEELLRTLELCYCRDSIVTVFKKNICIETKAKIHRAFYHPYGKDSFLRSLKKDKVKSLLDVGCGNASASYIKDVCPWIYYVGLDVGDYNQDDNSMQKMEQYIVVPPLKFAESIEKMQDSYDVIISSHNIEHCNEPRRVVAAMAKALNKNGRLYMAFPSEKSVRLPSRGGTLNFYDDDTHVYVPEFDWIVQELERNGLIIEIAKRTYRPLGCVLKGIRNERLSRRTNKVLDGTWALYGFEAVIWAKK